jgi:hypothetical protein
MMKLKDGAAVTVEDRDMNFDFTIFENGWKYIQSLVRWFEALDPISRNTVVAVLAICVSLFALYPTYRGYKLALARDTREDYGAQLGAASEEEAGNPATVPETLIVLAKHRAPDMRKRVAFNPSTPNSTLIMLAADSVQAVRLAVARNVRTPPPSLARLAKDLETEVRLAVADNPRTPPKTLTKLVNRPNLAVRLLLKLGNIIGLSKPRAKGQIQDYQTRVRLAVAGNSNTLPETLDWLAKDTDAAVRRAVAEHSNSWPETLDGLAKDVKAAVRRAVARNSNSRPDTLDGLAEDADRAVCIGVADNKRTRPAVIAKLIKHHDNTVDAVAGKNPGAPPRELVMYRTIRHSLVRDSIRGNPALHAAIKIMACDSDWVTRQKVAELSETPENVLHMLAQDDNAAVKETAIKTLAERANCRPHRGLRR